MIESLIALDQKIFLTLNGLHNAFFDQFFFSITSLLVWLPFLLVLLFLIIRRERNFKKIFCFIIFVALTILIADQVSSSILKPLVARLRPARDPAIMDLVHTVNDYRGGRFSFVSSHAANSFGIALMLLLFLKNRWSALVLFIWAALFSYSRIYLGVHYLGDILGGIVVGFFAATISYYIYTYIISKRTTFKLIPFNNSDALILSISAMVNVIALLIYIAFK